MCLFVPLHHEKYTTYQYEIISITGLLSCLLHRHYVCLCTTQKRPSGGGVINIVTEKQPRRWFADASYSYGSFNTHKSYVHFGQALKNGFTYEVNAFQNYSATTTGWTLP